MFVPKLIRFAIGLLGVLVLLATPAWAGDLTLTGTVTYYERIALPPGSRLRVTLVEMDGMAPVVGASSSIPASGSVPVRFSLQLSTDAAETGKPHGLLAEISSQGRVMFRNAQPVPVNLHATVPVEVVVNFSPAPPPDPQPEEPMSPPAGPLLDTRWKVTSIGGRPVAGQRPLTLSVAADHQVGGSGGCNNYFTEVSMSETTLSFGPPAATRMACAPEVMEQEAAFFAALAAVASYELDGSGLRLLDAAGVPLVGLVRETE